MMFARIDVRDLLGPLRAELMALLPGLSAGEWRLPTACPGWSVHDIAAHLLGVEAGNVSARRDHWRLGPGPDEDPDAWLDGFNQQWVEAARRISPALLTELLGVAGQRFDEHAGTLDLDAPGAAVRWATGDQPAPVWLDVAREYMERYVHQRQIRSACGRPPLDGRLGAPVVAIAVHALPLALAGVHRPAGTTVALIVDGEHGSAWHATAAADGWQLGRGTPAGPPACAVHATVDAAIGSFVRDPAAPPLTWQGDGELAAAVAGARAILGR